MTQTFSYISLGLYVMVGLITLMVGIMFLTARQFFPYHAQATGLSWDQVTPSLRPVFLAVMRVAGLGFLSVAILMILFPILTLMMPNPYLKLGIPLTGLVFWTGMFLVTYNVHRKTQADTPWKNSLVAMGMVLIGIVLSTL